MYSIFSIPYNAIRWLGGIYVRHPDLRIIHVFKHILLGLAIYNSEHKLIRRASVGIARNVAQKDTPMLKHLTKISRRIARIEKERPVSQCWQVGTSRFGYQKF
jgi:hypothetical protein